MSLMYLSCSVVSNLIFIKDCTKKKDQKSIWGEDEEMKQNNVLSQIMKLFDNKNNLLVFI